MSGANTNRSIVSLQKYVQKEAKMKFGANLLNRAMVRIDL